MPRCTMSDASAAFEPRGSFPLPPPLDGLARLGDLPTFGLMSGFTSGFTSAGGGEGEGLKSNPEPAPESLLLSLRCLRFMPDVDAQVESC